MNPIADKNNSSFLYREHDWATTWSRELALNWHCQKNNELAKFWSTRESALEFWAKIKAQYSFYDPIIGCIPVRPGDRVLDIGGGPGTIALPLARKGARVTVVEPAEGMVSVLADNIRQEGISGISIIRARWEEVRPADLDGPFDQVIACFSLGMPDIGEEIEKMIEVCSGTITLVWFSGHNAWDQMMNGICSGSCGSRYHESPKSDLLNLVLARMGIDPEIRVFRQNFYEQFDSFDDALLRVSQRCSSRYEGKEDRIRRWIGENMRNVGGKVVWNPEVTVSILSWDVKRRDDGDRSLSYP